MCYTAQYPEIAMTSLDAALMLLKSKARPDQLAGMAHYGMSVEHRLGLSMPEMRAIARQIGKDHRLALELWQTGFAEARILASIIADPKAMKDTVMEDWVVGFNSWDVCDQVCMNLFEKTSQAWRKVSEWSVRDEEYVKRAAYALLACLAWHDNKAADEQFIALLPVIVAGATDGRNYVKKAVSWALRNIGKRNLILNQASIRTAHEIQMLDSKAARWVAADALRELESESTKARLSKVQ